MTIKPFLAVAIAPFLLLAAPAWAQKHAEAAPSPSPEAALAAVDRRLSDAYALYLYESLTAQVLSNEGLFFFSSRRRHTRSVSAFLLNRSSDLNALRDYFRDIGRMVLAAEGRKANDSHADCYQYFCVPEYGTANGRLHFHAVHFMRTLPTGSVDPNFGRR